MSTDFPPSLPHTVYLHPSFSDLPASIIYWQRHSIVPVNYDRYPRRQEQHVALFPEGHTHPTLDARNPVFSSHELNCRSHFLGPSSTRVQCFRRCTFPSGPDASLADDVLDKWITERHDYCTIAQRYVIPQPREWSLRWAAEIASAVWILNDLEECSMRDALPAEHRREKRVVCLID